MQKILLLILSLACLLPSFADEPDYIEQRADRLVIYPQRMELQEGETLMDLLQIYPELLVAGYDDLLPGYQLRMDNVRMVGDIRLLLTQIKAKDLRYVQIVDNPGVIKGTLGMAGVIDISLMPAAKGLHTMAEMQAETDGSLAPTLGLRHQGEQASLWMNTAYVHQGHETDYRHHEYFDANFATQVGQRDWLITNLQQDYAKASAASLYDSRQGYSAKVRYQHFVGDRGAELMTLLSYQYACAPQSTALWRMGTREQVPLYMMEYNTPLWTPQMTLAVGVEGDFCISRYSATKGEEFDAHSRYNIFNQDFYFQWNYDLGKVKLTVGDRMMLFYYGMGGYSGSWSRYVLRNMVQGSVIYTPNSRHRLQLGYYRRFIPPAPLSIFPETWPLATDGQWTTGNPAIEATTVDQVKLAYGYTARTLSLGVTSSYYRVGDEDMCNVDASLYYKHRAWRLTAGAGGHFEHASTYWHLRLRPSLVLPCAFRVSAEAIYASDLSPHKRLSGTNLYAALSLSRRFGSAWDVALSWHDICSRAHSALMASVSLRY